MIFRDRDQAARLLFEKLGDFREQKPLVLGFADGSLAMAKVIADALNSDVDVNLIRRFRLPNRPEYEMGAVSEDGDVYLGAGFESSLVDEKELTEVATHEIDHLQAQRRRLTPNRKSLNPKGRTVLLVADGIAKGCEAIASVRNLFENEAARVVVIVPVISAQAYARIEADGAEIRTLYVPETFTSVNHYYLQYTDLEEDEIVRILKGGKPDVILREDGLDLVGQLVVPDRARGLILFAQGKMSGRRQPHNQYMARLFQEEGFATLMADVMTAEENESPTQSLDIEFLSRRMVSIMKWIDEDEQLRKLPLCLLGASTGTAAALLSAADSGRISAIVSRGGRSDLAWEALSHIRAPTLLIVGELDKTMIAQTKEAYEQLQCKKDLAIVPGATHHFQEPGTLDKAARLAMEWFASHVAANIDIGEIRPDRSLMS